MKKLVSSAVLALVTATGCVGPNTGGLAVALGEGDGQAVVSVDDVAFSKHVAVEEAFVRRATTGFLEARVRVCNRFDRDFQVQYKFEWFDDAGLEIQPGGRPWEVLTLHGGENASLAAVAPEKCAVKFIALMRRVR